MFGWDFHNSKSDRIKLYLFLLFVFLVIGFAVSTVFRSVNHEDAETIVSPKQDTKDSKQPLNVTSSTDREEAYMVGKNEYDQTERFSSEELEATQMIAIEFVTAFHTYDADEPMAYLEQAKPYMTKALYEKMKRNGRREVLERSNLTVRKTEITPVVNKSKLVIRWNVMVKGKAKSYEGKVKETEDWYLVGLRDVEGEWKVEDVRVNVPN